MNIAIIGGGFCGTMLAARLLVSNRNSRLRIFLIEKRADLGKGAAYSTGKGYHLLNVKAEKMSAFPEYPYDFENWLREKNIPLSDSGHMPRKLYGMYLKETLNKAIQKSSATCTLRIVKKEATDIDVRNGRGYIRLESGELLEADRIILATGNFPPAVLPYNLPAAYYCEDPWRCDQLDYLDTNKTVLMVGTGLTMVDLCMTLYQNSHKGKIMSISTHGYLPAVHDYSESYPSFYEEFKHVSSLTDVFRIVRSHLKNASEGGKNWRSVIDALRPYTQQLWMKFTDPDKKSFLKNLNRIWSISRHRIPPEYGNMLEELKAESRLIIFKGKILSMQLTNGRIEVVIRKRGTFLQEKIYADYVINCTGPQINFTKIDQPLIKNLLNKKLIEPGPLQMGLNADANGRIICEDKVSDILFTIGPALTGILFETTAVPELREQVRNLEGLLNKEIQSLNMVRSIG